MFQLGEKQRLIIAKKVEFGVYLSEDGRDSAEKVLLPVKSLKNFSLQTASATRLRTMFQLF